MTHARTQLRGYVSSVVLAPVAAYATIFDTVRSIKPAFPYVSVFVARERSVVENPGHINAEKRYSRVVDLNVEVGVDSGVDALDALCVHVEKAFAASDTMGGGVSAVDLIQVDFRNVQNMEKHVQIAVMIYQISFRTTAADPETFLG